MGETKYCVYIDSVCVAKGLALEYAIIFIRALFERFYNDHEMRVSIEEEMRVSIKEKKE